MFLHHYSLSASMAKPMVILNLLERYIKETHYLLICFFYVQNVSLLYWHERRRKSSYMACLFVGEHLASPIYCL